MSRAAWDGLVTLGLPRATAPAMQPAAAEQRARCVGGMRARSVCKYHNECYSKVFDNRMITDRRVATIDNGSPEIIESSVEGILAPRRTVALLSYYRINAVTDAGTRLPSLRSAG
jgi:hypothetical protein